MANFEKPKTNFMKNEKKWDNIKHHFFTSSLPLHIFYKEHWELYGYKNSEMFRKALISHNITVKERTKYLMENKRSVPIKMDPMDWDSLDDFGIAQSIGQEYTSAQLPGHIKKVGIMSDVHFPFHDLDALKCAIKHFKEQEIDCLYLNGDIFDFYSISRHEKDKDLRDFAREVEMCRQFMYKLRDIFGHIPIYYKLGNHEDRYARSLQMQAEEFAQIHDLQFEVFFHLDRLKYEVIDSWRGMEMGDLLVLHGHELYGGGGVNPSQNLFNKTICNTLIGHVHKTSSTIKKTGFKQFIHTYSTGCLTALSPKYMPFSQHNHGCAIVEINEGKTKVSNIMIKNGKIV
jgi:predicted phosphodiesterase